MRATTRMPRFLGGGDAFAEEVAVVEELSVAMKGHLRGVEGEDAGDADEDDVRVGGVPVVGPLRRCS